MKLSTGLAILATLSVITHVSKAGILAVVNPSFETPAVAKGVTTPHGITGWTATFIPLVLNPSTSDTIGGVAPDGSNVAAVIAYSNLGGNLLTQTLSSTLTTGDTYTLSVDVGQPLPTAGDAWLGVPAQWSGYQVILLAGSTVIAEDNNSLSVPVGGFVTSTISRTRRMPAIPS